MISGKVWGNTQLIHANGVFEFHRIQIKAGGYCSKHKHQYKWNGFFVEDGLLEISVHKNDYDLVDTTVLCPGEFTRVKPGEFHSFKALADTIAYEVYWAEFSHDDIIRETVGGTSNAGESMSGSGETGL